MTAAAAAAAAATTVDAAAATTIPKASNCSETLVFLAMTDRPETPQDAEDDADRGPFALHSKDTVERGESLRYCMMIYRTLSYGTVRSCTALYRTVLFYIVLWKDFQLQIAICLSRFDYSLRLFVYQIVLLTRLIDRNCI